jgi:hypothetical protein
VDKYAGLVNALDYKKVSGVRKKIEAICTYVDVGWIGVNIGANRSRVKAKYTFI